MYTNISIDSYRGLKQVKLSDLGRVNVLIGDNNTGKTSVLEAIRLFGTKEVISRIVRVATDREAKKPINMNYSARYEYVKYSFPLGNESSFICVSAVDDNGNTFSTYADMQESYIPLEQIDFPKSFDNVLSLYINDDNKIKTIQGTYKTRDGIGETDGNYLIPQIGRISNVDEHTGYTGEGRSVGSAKYISPADVYFGGYINSFIKGLPKLEKDRLISLMQVFDDRILNIEASIEYRNSSVLIEDKFHIIKPLSVYGDGMKRAFSVAGAIARQTAGVLLLDEFDTGIHRNALPEYTKFLSIASKKNDTQLFLTTHSGDAINALIEAYDGGTDLNVYKLESYNGDIYARKYEGEDLHRMRVEQGMELI